jgi:hypothetical protein
MSGTLSTPTVGQPNTTEDPKVATAVSTLNAKLDGSNNLDGAALAAGTVAAAALASGAALSNLGSGTVPWSKLAGTSVQSQLGVNDGTTVSRGQNPIATPESRTNTAYGLMTTPDRVQNVVLPTNGLIFVAFQALWQESVVDAARAALFIGSNQLKVRSVDTAAPATQGARTGAAINVNTYRPLVSSAAGLASGTKGTVVSTSDVTTGQVVGAVDPDTTASPNLAMDIGGTEVDLTGNGAAAGAVMVFAAAGTYDVSVQFKASSGSVTAKERTLWVWTQGF